MAERWCSISGCGAGAIPGESPIVVVGGGRIGRAFLQMAGARAMLVRRGERVAEGDGPVIVASHCSHLDDVLQRTPRSRWANLVFLQNGMLQPWLTARNLHQNTQGVLYMSAAVDTSLPDGRVRIVSGGRDSLVWGRWASLVVSLMRKEGLPSSVVTSHESFLEKVVEKLLWSSIFWLLSSALGGLPVGLIATKHRRDVHGLVTELLPLALKEKSPKPSVDTVVHELCAYCIAIETAIPSIEMAMSEFEWRNGWFLREQSTFGRSDSIRALSRQSQEALSTPGTTRATNIETTRQLDSLVAPTLNSMVQALDSHQSFFLRRHTRIAHPVF